METTFRHITAYKYLTAIPFEIRTCLYFHTQCDRKQELQGNSNCRQPFQTFQAQNHEWHNNETEKTQTGTIKCQQSHSSHLHSRIMISAVQCLTYTRCSTAYLAVFVCLPITDRAAQSTAAVTNNILYRLQ